MEKEPKKIFAVTLRTYGNDLSKRWRVEYYQASHNGSHKQRKIIYGNINQGETVEKRLELAQSIIESLGAGVAEKQNFIQQLIDEMAIQWRYKTKCAYTTVAKKFCEYIKPKRPQNVNADTVIAFLNESKRLGASAGTLHGYRVKLNHLFAMGVKRGLVLNNPVKIVETIKRSPSSLQYFTDKQIAQIKAACEGTQLWLAIRLLFYCFVRPGELRLLKIEHINFEMGFIEIPAAISKNKKTQKVVIPEHFLMELEFLKDYHNSLYIISPSGAPGPVPVGVNYLNYQHSKVLDSLKIRGRYAFYSWKHTGVVKCVQAKLNIRDIQNQLRHHSLDMVQEYLKSLGVLQSEDLKNNFPVL